MEHLDGEDLDHRLRRVGRLSIEIAVHVVRQVASALNAAHDQGIVHRDLKPGNIFISQIPGEPDFVKVLDFGISKMKAARTQLTSASAVIGTPNYMSPEQASGMVEEIDHRADQWALGCIAWEMLLGRGPFVADDAGALFYQIIHQDPHPLTPRVPGLPADVEPVLRRALHKQPAGRFSSMRDFARAFEAAAFGRSADATPAPVLMPVPPPSNATIGYSATRFQGAPAVKPVVRPAIRTPQAAPKLEVVAREPVARVVRSARKPEAETREPIDDLVPVTFWSKIKPIQAVFVGVGVLLLLLVTFLLLRSGSAPKVPPVSPAPSVVTPLPQSPAPTTVKPLPTEPKTTLSRAESTSGKRPKRSDVVNSRKKPNPFGDDPFEAYPKPKPKSKAKKGLYEDL
jgi:serine/threonine-protein kinase